MAEYQTSIELGRLQSPAFQVSMVQAAGQI